VITLFALWLLIGGCVAYLVLRLVQMRRELEHLLSNGSEAASQKTEKAAAEEWLDPGLQMMMVGTGAFAQVRDEEHEAQSAVKRGATYRFKSPNRETPQTKAALVNEVRELFAMI